MKLTRIRFHAFSQGDSIKADIKGGWCAGLTAMISDAVGGYGGIESLQTEEEWIKHGYNQAVKVLEKINDKNRQSAVRQLQNWLKAVKNKEDVSGELHTEDFNGRGCKVLLSAHGWVPVVGYVSYLWKWGWVINHVGYIVRAGKFLLIFEPNYGVGLYTVDDNKKLTLSDLNTVIGDLAWQCGGTYYYLSSTKAIAVVDEDSLNLRISRTMERQSKELADMAKLFLKH